MATAKTTLVTLDPQVTVTSGVPTRLTSSDLYAIAIIVKAHKDNVGNIYIAFTAADATSAKGFDLEPGQAWTFEADANRGVVRPINIKDIFIDGGTTGDKVVVHYAR